RDLFTNVGIGGRASSDSRCRNRDKERRNGCGYPVSYSQDCVGFYGIANQHIVLQNADSQSGDYVDSSNQYGGNSVTLSETDRTIHCSVKLCCLTDLSSSPLRFMLINDAGSKVCVDSHLLARHC